jgi:hypothetical protein
VRGRAVEAHLRVDVGEVVVRADLDGSVSGVGDLQLEASASRTQLDRLVPQDVPQTIGL